MQVLKQVGWYLYAVLATVLTLGVFIRFHLVTVRMNQLGGLRAGGLGGAHVYHELGTTSGADSPPATLSTYKPWVPRVLRSDRNASCVPSGDQRDYLFAKHYNLPIIQIIDIQKIETEADPTKEGRYVNSGFINGLNYKEATAAVIAKLEEAGAGTGAGFYG